MIRNKREIISKNTGKISSKLTQEVMFMILIKNRIIKGSALPMVLIVMMIMSTIGIAVLGFIYSEFMMELSIGKINKAYYSAETGVEILEKNLNIKIEQLQLKAKKQTDLYITNIISSKEQLEFFPRYELLNTDGSIDIKAITNLYNEKYLEFLKLEINDITGFFMNIENQENKNMLIGADENSQEAQITIGTDNKNRTKLLSAYFNSDENKVNFVIQGDYVNGSKIISQKIFVSYSILYAIDDIHFQPVLMTSVQKPVIPEILKKAVVTEKNLISAGGEVDITGDVLCFGTIPVNNGMEDINAESYKYGGLLAGIPDISFINYNGGTFGDYFGFDISKTNIKKTGSINILKDVEKGSNGHLATMGYLHTLYSTMDKSSQIYVQGSTFTRAIKSEEQATNSKIILSDAYNIDDLEIDSDNSNITINGKYYGMISSHNDLNGSGVFENENYVEVDDKNSSGVIINGNSTINLNGTSEGGVFVGGSSFFKYLLAKDNYPGEKIFYMTGISGLKSGTRLKYAYMEDNVIDGETRLYYDDGRYYLIDDISTKYYSNISNPLNIFNNNMIYGRNGEFGLKDRAKHFKWLWEGVWKNNNLYKRYLDTTSIEIKTDSDGKINGYAAGVFIANGNVNDEAGFKSEVDFNKFNIMKRGAKDQEGLFYNYHQEIKPLITDVYDYQKPKLDYIEPKKHIMDYIDENLKNEYKEPKFLGNNTLSPYFVYIKEGDCNIKNIDSAWEIDGYNIPIQSGIIISTGNIYIDDGFNFTGVILTAKNLIFSGKASIVYDKYFVENMLLDSDIFRLFKCEKYLFDENKITGQRISNKNLKLTNWKKLN